MLIYKVTLTMNGENLSPSKLKNMGKNDFVIFDQNEPNDLIWENKSDKYNFGSISIIQKSVYCLKNEFDNYEKSYRNFFSENKQSLFELGVEQIVYNIDVYYSDFCSFELSGSENYSYYQDFNFSIPVNVYKLSENEILEMLTESGYKKEMIENYEW